ncbi:MAG: glucose 1-dehydrogenase [Alphaproteobacteria bacterium]|nr:glucose 1-dehydrogenase [Alphaproteobacteria bacterium]
MTAFDLTGKVALVTGGNGGIGLGMAKGLAEAGATVMVAGRDADKNSRAVIALGGNADSVSADMADEDGVKAVVDATVQKFGRLDILVNNAGINIRKSPQDYALEEWHRVLNINLTSLFVCCQAAYPHLKMRGGKIINIGSMMSIFGASFAAPYGASKGGVVQLTKSLASAWAAENIQVNAVLPGWIDTELTKGARQQVSGLHEKVLARTPAGRWGAPQDMAGIAIFLASPASDFITGTAIPVDGGYAAQG